MTHRWWTRLRPRLRALLREPMVVAFVAAGGIAALLAGAVFFPWSANGDDAARTPREIAAPVATSTPPPSPTPAPPAERRPTVRPTPATSRRAPPTVPPPTATTEPTSIPRPAPTTAPPEPTPTPGPLYEATAGTDLAAWTGPSWGFANNLLVNDGSAINPQPWLAAPYQPEDDTYAVEAEIRVRGLTREWCDQTFGVVAGTGGMVWGGGVIFGCDGVPPRVRITEATDWSNGFHKDPEVAAKVFDPGEGWHTYRVEVRGQSVRLLIDGEPILEAAAAAAADGQAAPAPGQVGLWSQAVLLAVRRFAVLPL